MADLQFIQQGAEFVLAAVLVQVRAQLQHQPDVVGHAQLAEHRRLLRQVAQAQLGACVHRLVGDVLAVQHDAAGVGRHQSDDHVEAGGLAGAVGPEQAETLAAPHSQVEAAHHFGVGVFFCQAAYLQHGQASRNACFSSFSLPWKKCPASGMAFTASCCCSAHSRIAVGGMSSSASPKITIVSGGTGSNSYMVTAGATRIRRFAWSSWRSRCCTKAPNEKPANAHGRPG
ncbi:hypothetical protein SDC9_180413 [bioreactor metagenome]|uniref:Uncharacterized protein n=1 Tax=bioreactor metagenome TaxID=1076179 RepID=A0A645H2M1_9ZZZZ